MRSTVVTDDCLGDEPAFMEWNGKRINCKLKAGQTQHMCFQPGDPPPFYEPDAPEFDTYREVEDEKGERGVKLFRGNVGKPKGKKQVLWEGGLWKTGLRCGPKVPRNENIDIILGECPDFMKEQSQLQHLVKSRGHRLIMSPKCHPELAGVGIEYSWGKSKLEFRRGINDCVALHLEKNVREALDTADVLTLGRVRLYARKTRDYRRVYAMISEDGEAIHSRNADGKEGYALIETMVKTRKAHRNIVDMEQRFLNST